GLDYNRRLFGFGQAWTQRTQEAQMAAQVPAKPAAMPVLGDGADMKDMLMRLSHAHLLRALPPQEMDHLLPHIYRVTVSQGEQVFQKGDAGNALYIIEGGTAEIERDGEKKTLGVDDVLGQEVLLHGEPWDATVTALSDLLLWRITREDYLSAFQVSPELKAAHEAAVDQHRSGAALASEGMEHQRAWVGTALRAAAAKRRGLQPWHFILLVGFGIWLLLRLNESIGWIDVEANELLIAGIQLVAGLLLIEAASEALILATDRTGARFNWDGFTSGTIGSLVETMPEFFVIAFLVLVAPFAAFLTSAITLFNNALAFSIYSFFLPKDRKGSFVMPESMSKAGSEVLIAGSGLSLIVGIVMLGSRVEGVKIALSPVDLLVLAVVFISIYCYYQYVAVKYYAEGYGADSPSHPPDPGKLGHATGWGAIAFPAALGLIASYFGGDAIGAFADTTINHLHLPEVPTAAALAFFAGMSEFVVVAQAHRRGEIGIALSNTFGGLTQVQTLLLPFAMGCIGIFGLVIGGSIYSIPINIHTIMLMILQFPMLYVLLSFIEEDHTLNVFDAVAMTGIYALLLYFLFSF
ncbi:MAG TPA: cyclic nucleotide-binding domain-containing protein, partial [Chloroflexota bacterium]